MTQNLFPLPLTPFEESMLVDDQPAYPWNMLLRLRFTGNLDRDIFTAALRAAVQRHPLLCARVRKTWLGRYVWEAHDGDPAAQLHWNEHAAGEWPPLQKMDLQTGVSVETWVQADGTQAEVVLHGHHGAFDGQAIMQLTGDLMLAYDAIAQGKPPADRLAKLEPQRLASRGRYGYTVRDLFRLAPQLWVGVKGIRQFLGRKAVPLISHTAAPRSERLPPTYPSTRSHTFSRSDTLLIRAVSRQYGVTGNDVLTRDLFAALGAWRQRHSHRHGEWLRVAIPFSMRRREDSATPAANVVSLIFLDRREADLIESENLLRGLNAEMNEIKDNRLGLIYLLTLKPPSWIPGLMGWIAQRQKLSSTVVFTNLMRPFKLLRLKRDDERVLIGAARLENVEIMAPLRPYTCATFGAATYAGRLSVSVLADPRFLSPAEIDDLLACYVSAITTTMQNAPTTPVAAGGDADREDG